MEISPEDLQSLFLCDPSMSIDYCKMIICSASNFESFNDFYNFHFQNIRVSTCQANWSTDQMCIHCTTCQNSPHSCICLQCYLNGNHQGHNIHINKSPSGSCDCGDLTLWKRTGFCTKHHGTDLDSHPENYLDENLRKLLTDVIFKSTFSAIKHLPHNDSTNLSIILEFLKIFLKLGDGFRRLIVISLTEKINFSEFFNIIFDASNDFNSKLCEFFGFLANDQLFIEKFTVIVYNLMTAKIIPIELKLINGNEQSKNIYPWTRFWFHCFFFKNMECCIEKYNFNWVDFFIQVLNFDKELLLLDYKLIDYKFIPSMLKRCYDVEFATQVEPNEQTQKFFDLFFTQVVTTGTSKGIRNNVNDTIFITSFNENLPKDYFDPLFFFYLYFFGSLIAFKSKENLKFDVMFDVLDKKFDIAPIYLLGKNENDRLLSFLNDFEIIPDNYKSFRNGASFFICHPIYFPLMYLLRNDEMSRIKIARFFSLEKHQNLRVKLGISILKNLLSFVCANQSFVPKTNAAAIQFLINHFSENRQNASYGISLYLPLLQLLIGIHCNEMNEFNLKEFFAFGMAREIGIFDDQNETSEENKKQMIFVFLYSALLLVIDRTHFNFDGYSFIKEQIIFEMKNGVSDLNKLLMCFDSYVNPFDSPSIALNNIIYEVATQRQSGNNGILNNSENNATFSLKEEVECKFISAVNLIKREQIMMNNEISKHPEQLLKIQQFEPEETYFLQGEDAKDLNICLKEFLLTPTVLAIVYKTLRQDSQSHKVELNEHLAMNILILISKFVQESENEQQQHSFKDVCYDSTIVDLISQLRRVVFNFKEKENGSVTIENTLNKKSFNSFLKMKIRSNNEEPKSIIDILLEKGEIGKSVMSQMSVEIGDICDEKDKEDFDKMKKIRARKMKEDIMNQYKNISSSLSLNDEFDDEDDDDEAKETCSVCSMTKENEVLFYPLNIYKTKFPFIIDKPPHCRMQKKVAIKEAEVYQDEEILGQLTDFVEDEEDTRIPDPDEIFAIMLSQSPNLDITSDLNESEAQRRRELIDLIHTEAMQRHQALVQESHNRMKQRREQKMQEVRAKKEEVNQKKLQMEDPDSFVTKCCTPGNLFVIQFNICQHLVHADCVNNESFNCPIDRTFKNGLLPNIEDIKCGSENMTNELKSALTLFIDKYTSFFNSSEEKIVDVFVELIKSISGLIATYEVRLRSLPDCLDSKKTKYLSRNLFLTTYYAYRMKGKPNMLTGFVDDVSEDVESKMTLFQQFVKKLIENDLVEKDEQAKKQAIQETVSFLMKTATFNNEKEKCLFLRRVCLSAHFLLKKEKTGKNDEIVKWDEVLSTQNLSQMFNVEFSKETAFEFKPFVFSKLPKEFLRFAQPPYNFPIEQFNQVMCFSILDYNRMITDYSESDDSGNYVDYMDDFIVIEDNSVGKRLKTLFSDRNYPTVLLFVGFSASRVAVIYGKKFSLLSPFYLDKFGCTGVGYERGEPLFLNEEIYERVMDNVLSGEFLNGMKAL